MGSMAWDDWRQYVRVDKGGHLHTSVAGYRYMQKRALEEAARRGVNEYGVAFPCVRHRDREAFVDLDGEWLCRECWNDTR